MTVIVVAVGTSVVPSSYESVRDSCPRRVGDDGDDGGGLVRWVPGSLFNVEKVI